jgi:large subunit ribosomal protein L9
MELILKQDVENLGYKDEILKVRNGYGRNFLIPRGMAAMATESGKKVLAENLKQRSHKEAKNVEAAKAMVEKLVNTTLVVGAKVGEKGKIFGSVNTIQLADALKKAGFEVDRKRITIKEMPIKVIGKYKADVVLHKDVVTTIEFEVVGE